MRDAQSVPQRRRDDLFVAPRCGRLGKGRGTTGHHESVHGRLHDGIPNDGRVLPKVGRWDSCSPIREGSGIHVCPLPVCLFSFPREPEQILWAMPSGK